MTAKEQGLPELPGLPEPVDAMSRAAWGPKPDYYTADQMRAYALAALASDTGGRGVGDRDREDLRFLIAFTIPHPIREFVLSNLVDRGWLTDGGNRGNPCVLTKEGAALVEAALRAQPAGGGWLPIESAPRDGTPILLGYTNSHAEEGFWMGDASRNHWNETGWYATGEDVLCEHPSHPDVWQPLPAAPAQPDGVGK